MLVVNRERLGGVFHEQRRTSGRVEHLPPADGRAHVLPRAAQRHRERAQRIQADVVAIAGVRARFDRVLERCAGAILAARTRVHASERERFTRIARLARPDARQVQQARRQRRERYQVQPPNPTRPRTTSAATASRPHRATRESSRNARSQSSTPTLS